MLKSLNATMTAIRVQQSAYSSSGAAVDEVIAPLVAERNRLIVGIQQGSYDIPTAAVERVAAAGSMALLRT